MKRLLEMKQRTQFHGAYIYGAARDENGARARESCRNRCRRHDKYFIRCLPSLIQCAFAQNRRVEMRFHQIKHTAWLRLRKLDISFNIIYNHA
jgi:hypothetical protein